MVLDKCKEVQNLMNKIDKYEHYLDCLNGYEDEFQIAYNGTVVCDLEQGLLLMIKTNYKDAIAACRKTLEQL